MRNVMYLFAAALLIAGCAKENIAPEKAEAPAGGVTVLQVGLPQTKTTLGDKDGSKRKIYWSDGDCISVNGTASEALSNVPAQCTSALFSFNSTVSAPYSILYPASVWKDAGTITLPASQSFVSGTFADGSLPMAGYATSGSSPTLSHICAVVKIPLVLSSDEEADKDKIVSISIKGGADEQMCGDFSIDYSTASISATGTNAANKTVEMALNHSLSTENALDIYMVIPAGEYASGFTVTVTDVNGHYMKKSSATTVSLVAGHLYALPELSFEPTGTELNVDISSAEDLVAFAKDFNNSVYYSKQLRVTLLNDISFSATTSAAFSATGGIGCADDGSGNSNYFNGIFEGNGKTISKYTGSAPLFAYTGSNSMVRNFSIDSSCSWTFTHSNAADAFLGCVVGYHRGQLDNVNVAANVSISNASVDFITYLGGVVGRVVIGSVSNVSYSGNISISDGFTSNGKRLFIGGIAGGITNAFGTLADSRFEGTIDFAGRVVSTDKSNPYLIIGGIVGSNSGTVSECTAASNPKLSAYNDSTFGTIVNRTTQAYNLAEAGIAGLNNGTVRQCTNNAELLNFVLTTGTDGTAADANSRYMFIGGVVGLNNSEAFVTDCENNAGIIERSTPRHQKVGGVVGCNHGIAYGLGNSGTIQVATAGVAPYGVRLLRMGGVIGELTGNTATCEDLKNDGTLQISRVENNANVDVAVGGVVGMAADGASLNGGDSKNVINTGSIEFTNGTTTNASTLGFGMGGIVGKASVSVSGAVNSGKVYYKANAEALMTNLWMGGIVGQMSEGATDLSKVSNSGEVLFESGKDFAHTENYVGGIAGRIDTGVLVSDAENSGTIRGGNTKKHNGASMYLGGVAAYATGASSFSNCKNTGALRNDQFNNNTSNTASCYEGGIVGYVAGSAESIIPVSNCEVTLAAYNDGVGPRRGYGGGIVGYASFANVSGCKVSGDFTGSSSYFIGGIAGWAVSSTISSCNYLGSAISTSQLQAAGGIAAVLDAGSSIANCNSDLASVSTTGSNELVFGGIAGKSVAECSISGCHYKSSIAICSDTNFTDGGGNAADR